MSPALPIEHAFGTEPFTVRRPAETRDRMNGLLEQLTVGMSLDVNRDRRATLAHVYRYAKERGLRGAFKVRGVRPGWSRVWRVR